MPRLQGCRGNVLTPILVHIINTVKRYLMLTKKPIFRFLSITVSFVAVAWFCNKNTEVSDPVLTNGTLSQILLTMSLQSNAVAGELRMTSEFTRAQDDFVGSTIVAKEQEPIESAQSEIAQLKIAGRKYPVFFESTDVPESLKSFIISDIELNLSHFKHITFSPIESEEAKQVFHAPVTHILDEGYQKRFYSEVFENYFGGAIMFGNTFQIVVHEKLIKAYEQAMEYQKAQSDMFKKLSLFLEQLKDKDFIAQIESNRNIAQKLILFDVSPPSSYDYGRELSGLLKHGNIRKPSLLDFNNVTYNGKNAVRFSTLIKWQESMSTEPFTKGFPQFLFLDENWFVYVPRLP